MQGDAEITHEIDTFDGLNGLALTFFRTGASKVGAVEHATAGSDIVSLVSWLVPRMRGADDLETGGKELLAVLCWEALSSFSFMFTFHYSLFLSSPFFHKLWHILCFHFIFSLFVISSMKPWSGRGSSKIRFCRVPFFIMLC